MRKDLVKYQDDDYSVEIEVGQANVEMGLARSDLWFDARTGDLAERSMMFRVGVLQTYPACVAGTLSVTNMPKRDEEGELVLDEDGNEVLYPEQLTIEGLTVESYLTLPEAMAMLWKDAVFALNPHWLPVLPEEETEEGEAEEPNEETS